MKTVLWIGFAVLVGVAMGIAAAVLRLQLAPWHDDLAERLASQSGVGSASKLSPVAVVDQPEYHFGLLDVETQGEHDFVIRNTGLAPLQIIKGSTTCSCMLSDFTQADIPPGKSASITLKWKSKGLAGPYEQSGTVLTNDPAHPQLKLSVMGQFVTAVQAIPAEVQFGQISANETNYSAIKLYGYMDEPFKVTGYAFSDPAYAKFFDVAFAPLDPGQLKDEENVRSGFQIQIAAKSGLPLGAFRQTITVKTNVEKRPAIEIPIRGSVASDISIVGPGWNPDKGLLVIDSVSSQDGIQRRLIIFTRGPHRKEVKFKSAHAVPDLLKVEVGPTTPVGSGVVMQTPLTIEIPKGSPDANYLGTSGRPTGRITIETNHPTVPRLELRVAFAIEG